MSQFRKGLLEAGGMQTNTEYLSVMDAIETTTFCVDDNGKETMLIGLLVDGKIRLTRSSTTITDEEKAKKVYTVTYETIEADTQGRRNTLTLNFDLVTSSSNPKLRTCVCCKD